jgi:uncharacterized protein YbjT (DUF2867 family)
MKITVMGASGLVGSKVVALLTSSGHDVVGASRRSGADVLTGTGLAQALAGAQVLVDVTNAPSFEDAPVLAFFTASASNLVRAGKDAGIEHYVALSIVGVDGLPASGYMRAKVAQERTIAESGLPYTIVRATQFHEFAEAITRSLERGDEVHVPDARIQPIASADVAVMVSRVATARPHNGTIDIGGPDTMTFADMARAVLAAHGVNKRIVIDASATYFGSPVGESSLVTKEGAASGTTPFADWLARSAVLTAPVPGCSWPAPS